MVRTVIRESVVLLVGYLLPYGVFLALGDAGRNFGALVAAILVPIGFCLARASMVRPPLRHLPFPRRAAYQLVIGIALVTLLLFEMGTHMFMGADRVPLEWRHAVAGIGLAYVILFCLAQHIGFNDPQPVT